MEELSIPKLNSEQIEELCSIAERAARKYVLSRVPSKSVETLNICAEAEGTKPMTLMVEVNMALSPSMKDFDVQKLAEEAVKKAYASAERYLGELTCHSRE